MKLLLILLVISFSAFSASKKKCIKNLTQIQKIKGFELPEKLCDDKDFRKASVDKLVEYNQCLANIADVVSIYPRPYSSCVDEKLREKMNDNEYVLCEMTLIDDQLKSRVDSYCNTKTNRAKILSKDFSNCMDKTIPLDAQRSYRICMSNAKRSVVLSYNYDKCLRKRKPFDKSEKVEKCASMKVLTPQMKKALAACEADITGLNINSSACNDDSFRLMKNKRQCLSVTSKSIDMSNMSLYDIRDITKDAQKDCTKTTNLKELDNVSYLNSQYFSTSEFFDKHKVGGLSAVAYNDKDNSVYLVSDDQGIHGPSRVLKGVIISSDGSHMSIKLKENILFRRNKKLDAEGLQIDKDGNLIVSSETLDRDSETLLRRFSTDGDLIDELTTPDEYLKKFETIERDYSYTYNQRIRTNSLNPFAKPSYRYERKTEDRTRKESIQKQGILENKGFEALTFSSTKEFLYVANEQALAQDKDSVRISKLKAKDDDFERVASYLYKIDKGDGNGLVEIVEIEDNILLALERRYDSRLSKVIANIYKVDLTTAKANKALKKELFLDLDDLIDYLPAGLQKIDNIEGMGLGPKLANGSRSLILVSDNNFNRSQKTQIIYLELK